MNAFFKIRNFLHIKNDTNFYFSNGNINSLTLHLSSFDETSLFIFVELLKSLKFSKFEDNISKYI